MMIHIPHELGVRLMSGEILSRDAMLPYDDAKAMIREVAQLVAAETLKPVKTSGLPVFESPKRFNAVDYVGPTVWTSS